MDSGNFISSGNTVMVIIDVQEKLFRPIYEKEKLLDSLLRLIRGARAMEIPFIVTEQYPKGLGSTLPEIIDLLPEVKRLPKTVFSCYRDSGFRKELEGIARNQVLITGIETHVCVYQTTLDLLKTGYSVHIATDCVSSRTAENRALGIQRTSSAGAKLTSMEMVLFELLQIAEGDKFKAISDIVK